MGNAVCIAVYYRMFSGSTKKKKKKNFRKDRNFGSMYYFIHFSLKIKLLSPEFFSHVLQKGLCEGLLTKRFTQQGT